MYPDMNNQIIVEYVEIDETITLSGAVTLVASDQTPKDNTQETGKS